MYCVTLDKKASKSPQTQYLCGLRQFCVVKYSIKTTGQKAKYDIPKAIIPGCITRMRRLEVQKV